MGSHKNINVASLPLGEVIKRASIGQFIGIIGGTATLISAIFGLGFWLGSALKEVTIQKLELDIDQLERQLAVEQVERFTDSDRIQKYADAMRMKSDLLILLYEEQKHERLQEKLGALTCTGDLCNADCSSLSGEQYQICTQSISVKNSILNRARLLYGYIQGEQANNKYANPYLDLATDKEGRPVLRFDDGAMLRFPGIVE